MRRTAARGIHFFLALAMSASAALASLQTLRLDPLPPAPTLPSSNAAAKLAETMREELRAIESQQWPDEPARTVAQARVALRRVAFDLLARGAKTDSDPEGTRDILAMQGFRLADARRRVDLALGAFAEGTATMGNPPRPLGVRERDRLLRLLQRFVDVAPKALGNAALDDRTQVDAAIASAVGSLVDALAVLEGRGTGELLGSGFPSVDAIGAPSPSASTEATSELGADPCSLVADDTTGEDAQPGPRTRDAIRRHCADASGDLDAMASAALLSRSARLASWLSEEERAALDEAAAQSFELPALRPLISAQGRALAAEAALAADAKTADYDVKGIRAALRAALHPPADSPYAEGGPASDRLARQTRRIAESLEMGMTSRRRDRASDERLPRELRPLRREFERAYERVEASTFKSLSRLVTEADAATNPDLVGLLRGQRDALEDLDRLSQSRDLLDRLGGVRPQSVRGATQRVRTMLRWLLEPARRGEGLAAWNALTGQVALFVPMPHEEELRRETIDAIRLAAGEPRALIGVVDIARAEWADGWAEGDGGGKAAQRVHRLWRLLRVIESLASQGGAPDTRDAAPFLSRWGGFHCTRAAFAPAMTDLGALTKLAVSSAIAGDDAMLERELARLERSAPLSQLANRLSTTLGPWLSERPGGVLGSLAAVREPPGDRAWGSELRTRFAAIARYARELEDARRSGEASREPAYIEYLSRLADSTLEALGAERSPVVPLPELFEASPTDARPRRR